MLLTLVSAHRWLAGALLGLVLALVYSRWIQLFAVHRVQESNDKVGPLKRILLWNENIWPNSDGDELLEILDRAPTRCVVTSDRTLLTDSHAIVISGDDFNISDLPEHRQNEQRFVFHARKILSRHSDVFNLQQHYFNWTMTYRRDSDVYDPYPNPIIRTRSPATPVPDPAPQIHAKSKLVGWIRSAARITESRAEDYVAELAKHLAVDVYDSADEVDADLMRTYKFWMAAEDDLCPDYVTDQFYRPLASGVVPVVYGGVDYNDFAPSHSYINVVDFQSPQHLADYLRLLDQNDALYLGYFEWRCYFEMVRHQLTGWSQLCRKLYDPALSTQSYPKLGDYWFGSCLNGSDFIRNVHSDNI